MTDPVALVMYCWNDNPGVGGDVVFGVPDRQFTIVFSWVYEPDHPALSPAALSKQSAGHEQSAGHVRLEAKTDDDVDVTVRSAGYVQVPTENR